MTGPAWWQRLTPFDRKLVLVLTLLVLLSFGLLLRQPAAGSQLVASVADRVVYVAPLAAERELELQGSLGITRVRIAGGGARVLSSPCPNKVCIGLGEARHAGELLACVPNRVMVRIEGGAELQRGYDLLSR